MGYYKTKQLEEMDAEDILRTEQCKSCCDRFNPKTEGSADFPGFCEVCVDKLQKDLTDN